MLYNSENYFRVVPFTAPRIGIVIGDELNIICYKKCFIKVRRLISVTKLFHDKTKIDNVSRRQLALI